MSDFAGAVEAASQMVDDGQVDAELIGDLDVSEVITEMARLVSHELTGLTGLGEDPEANEAAMRTVMQNAAVKAFFTGLSIGRAAGVDPGLPIGVAPEALQEIGLRVLREGMCTFTLYAEDDE